MYTPKHDKPMIVAAISIDIEWSSCALSYAYHYSKDPLDVAAVLPKNRQQNREFYKSPTRILFNDKKQFHSFGYEAESYYEELLDCGMEGNWYYFTEFTSILIGQVESIRDLKLKDKRGRELPAIDVIAAAIKSLKIDIMQNMTEPYEEDFCWVIIASDASNDLSKQFLREAAIKAGISKDRLLLAVESDAAFVYYEHEFSRNSNGKLRKPGTKHVLVNAGGCMDVSVLGVQSDYTMKTLDFHGKIAGGDQVYAAFIELLTDLLGESTMKIFNNGDPEDVRNLEKEFKNKLQHNHSNKNVTLYVPLVLKDIFEDETDEDIQIVIKQSKYAGKFQWLSDRVRMNSDIYEELLQAGVVDTIKTIKSLVEKHKPIDSIMLIGSFANAAYLQQKIREAFSDKTIMIGIPGATHMVALAGAVIIGHNPVHSTVHFAKYTYGFATCKSFKSEIHAAEKKVIVKNGAYCQDLFEKHVEIGEILNPEIPQCDKIYKPSKAGQQYLELPLFASSVKDPDFVTGGSSFQIAQVKVVLPDSYSEDKLLINVKIYYGYRKLEVQAQDVLNDKKLQTRVEKSVKYDKTDFFFLSVPIRVPACVNLYNRGSGPPFCLQCQRKSELK